MNLRNLLTYGAGVVSVALTAAISPAQHSGSPSSPDILWIMPDQPAAAKGACTSAFQAATMQDWTVVSGQYSLADEGGRKLLRFDTGKDLCRMITGDSNLSDYSVEIKARALKWNSETYGDYGIIVRYVNPSNYYLFLYDSQPAVRAFIIQKKTDNKLQTVVSLPFTYELGRWYNWKGVVRGNNLEFWVDGKKILSAPADEIAKGSAGLLAWWADVQISDFVLTPVAGIENGVSVMQKQEPHIRN